MKNEIKTEKSDVLTKSNLEKKNILDIKIGSPDVSKLDKILRDLDELPRLTAKQFLNELRTNTNGYQSKLLQGIFDFLTILEKKMYQTYTDSRGDMTIGVGLDIQPPLHNDAEAVLLNVNPNWDFKDMQTYENRPEPPLKSNEIMQILYYTLIGAQYHSPDDRTVKFKGKTEDLIDHLNSNVAGLADVPFSPHQLIALQSLAFNQPNLIGKNICKALEAFSENKDPMDVLLQIMECSNKLYDKDGTAKKDTNGLQNRRLKEAGMFLGDPKAVHLSYRQFKRIEAALATLGQRVVPP